MGDVVSRRALNRATLERQLLLWRSNVSALEALEHLVGLRAQVPLNPYAALWSRLEGFRPQKLSRLLEDRRAVRSRMISAEGRAVLSRAGGVGLTQQPTTSAWSPSTDVSRPERLRARLDP